jgi:hypothetical protein
MPHHHSNPIPPYPSYPLLLPLPLLLQADNLSSIVKGSKNEAAAFFFTVFEKTLAGKNVNDLLAGPVAGGGGGGAAGEDSIHLHLFFLIFPMGGGALCSLQLHCVSISKIKGGGTCHSLITRCSY